MYNYRLRFVKEQSQKYLSHLEMIKAIERAIRRAQLQLAYSEGFHPHPKLSFGPALAVGIASVDEYFDMELVQEYSPEQVLGNLNRALPEGLKTLAVKRILHRVKPLNAVINRASYAMVLKAAPGEREQVINRLDNLLKLPIVEIVRTSKDRQKVVNIRPWLHTLTVGVKNEDLIEVQFGGEIGSGGNLRPDDILTAISLPVEVLNITRTGLWHQEGGLVMKPLDFCDKAGG